MSEKKYNVITIKWGTGYSSEDINKLYRGITRNVSVDINFYCFTEIAQGLNPNIIVKPLPQLNIAPEKIFRTNYMKAAGLCDDNIGDLKGQRVFFFDIDTIIVGNLDEFFKFPQGDKIYIINDWAHRSGPKANQVGQASCYSWVVGTLGYIKDYFEKNADAIKKQYGGATQQYMSAKIIEKYGPLNFWPDNWFKSFKFHCIPSPLLRHFITPKLPTEEGVKMIAFHGSPNINEAIDGIWGTNSRGVPPKGLKKIYKYILPTLWIKDYWK